MKILKLKFKNINSLVGENEIDFTQPVFTNDGLFAITGKTGAGKSSILDAISLALFGKTPRVVITGTENAVLTRGEKDCFSEITFETGGKKWISSWKQELTRTGNLKPVQRAISDSEGKIIAEKVNDCDKEIVTILGLSFEQFTKVIMLAQGSFTAFLQANKNDKGELLEQITGTEIYGEISMKVFERNRAEKEKLAKIAIELEAINILSDEEIENLKSGIATFVNERKQVETNLKTVEIAKNRLVELGKLQADINDAKTKLPELEETANTAKTALEQAEKTLQSAKNEMTKMEPVFKEVRELDTKIAERKNLLEPILKAISDLKFSKTALSNTIDEQNIQLTESTETLKEKKYWAEKNKKFEELITNFTAIENENQSLQNAKVELDSKKSNLRQLEINVGTKKTALEKATGLFIEKSEKLIQTTNKFDSKNNELNEILKGKELSDLQAERQNIKDFGQIIKSLIDIENALSASQKKMNDFVEKINFASKSEKTLIEKIDFDKKSVETFETQINLLDENIKLTKTIQSLDEHRQHLVDGKECPLCGATEHPFAVGNIPQMGEKEKELAGLKTDLKNILDSIKKDEIEATKLATEIKNAGENKANEATLMEENKLKQNGFLSEILLLQPDFSIPNTENRLEILSEIRSKKLEEYKLVDKIIVDADAIGKTIANLRDKEIPALQNEKQQAEKGKNEAETELKLEEQKVKSLQEIIEKDEDIFRKSNVKLKEKIENYGVENIIDLKKCLSDWNENSKKIDELSGKITKLTTDIALNKKELDNQIKSADEKLKDKQKIDNELTDLSGKRRELFAEKSVEGEEKSLKNLLNNAESAKEKQQTENNRLTVEMEKMKAVIIGKEKELAVMEKENDSEKTIDELQAEIDEKKVKLEELLQKIGANNQALKHNDDNLKNSGNKLKEKEKQQVISTKWASLNELIGSADGKKYRNFVQALTFEHLIGLANNQLLKMSDRYVLKRSDDKTNPFELSVLDRYQNSEIRTAQNLSGGEKFIVSLSLALGLSNMASKNIRIDTMFIDEGFGTLDSDYLDVALSALSNLQSEGKIIGVISHLTELKERIATHIEVLPSGNGHSRILIRG